MSTTTVLHIAGILAGGSYYMYQAEQAAELKKLDASRWGVVNGVPPPSTWKPAPDWNADMIAGKMRDSNGNVKGAQFY